ncbi:MAG: IS110 family transposase [Ignavibacteria bacterium]|nr:IS110 family transposase [Ignavibacteria bacterium]
MKQITKLNFKGQQIYIGLDVHIKSWTVSIFMDDLELETKNFPPSAQVLGSYLRRMFPSGEYLSVYEAGYSGYWIHEELEREGIRNIIVNPADVPTKDKEKRKKTNKVDSRKLGRSLRSKEIEGIYIRSKEVQEDRSLVRMRHRMVKKQTSCKNQIKGLLIFFGIFMSDEKLYSHWSKKYIEWILEQSQGTSGSSISIRSLVEELQGLRKIIAQITKQIRVLSNEERYKEKVRILRTIPGISVLSAMIILTELGDMNTYSRLDKLCSYVGLLPNESSTGEKETRFGIIKRGNKFLKKVLIESSWVAIRKDPALLQAFKDYKKRCIPTKAIIKISRKLLNRIRYVLISGDEYKLLTV